ncbi:MAG: PIN domain-containing protein [Chloroflexi bacterium]|nr:PIN domain-containing protein [Chloroflexota bacterium]
MSDPFVDTDVLIRLLTGDDLKKQAEAAALFEAVEAGRLTLAAPDTVIADAVYVLSSRRLYDKPRSDVAAMLSRLVSLPGFKVENRASVVRALDLYGATSLDFGDALIVASMEQRGSTILYSYDADFDRIPTVNRRLPGR